MSLQCSVCFEEHPQDNITNIDNHLVCHDCVSRPFELAIESEDSYPPKWGDRELEITEFYAFLTLDVRNQFLDKMAEYDVPPDSRTYCSSTNRNNGTVCGRFVGRIDSVHPHLVSRSMAGHSHVQFCRTCDTAYCVACGLRYAIDHECKPGAQKDDSAFEGLQLGKDYQICPSRRCRRKVQLKDGCNEVECYCRTNLCFICGQVAEYGHFRKSKPGGGCPRFGHPSAANPVWDTVLTLPPNVAALIRDELRRYRELERQMHRAPDREQYVRELQEQGLRFQIHRANGDLAGFLEARGRVHRDLGRALGRAENPYPMRHRDVEPTRRKIHSRENERPEGRQDISHYSEAHHRSLLSQIRQQISRTETPPNTLARPDSRTSMVPSEDVNYGVQANTANRTSVPEFLSHGDRNLGSRSNPVDVDSDVDSISDAHRRGVAPASNQPPLPRRVTQSSFLRSLQRLFPHARNVWRWPLARSTRENSSRPSQEPRSILHRSTSHGPQQRLFPHFPAHFARQNIIDNGPGLDQGRRANQLEDLPERWDHNVSNLPPLRRRRITQPSTATLWDRFMEEDPGSRSELASIPEDGNTQPLLSSSHVWRPRFRFPFTDDVITNEDQAEEEFVSQSSQSPDQSASDDISRF